MKVIAWQKPKIPLNAKQSDLPVLGGMSEMIVGHKLIGAMRVRCKGLDFKASSSEAGNGVSTTFRVGTNTCNRPAVIELNKFYYCPGCADQFLLEWRRRIATRKYQKRQA